MDLPEIPIARYSEYSGSNMPTSFQGLLVFKGKNCHSDKLSKLEDAQLRTIESRAKLSKFKSAQQSYTVLDAVLVHGSK